MLTTVLGYFFTLRRLVTLAVGLVGGIASAVVVRNMIEARPLPTQFGMTVIVMAGVFFAAEHLAPKTPAPPVA